MNPPKLSVVSTVYNSADLIWPFYCQLIESLVGFTHHYEIIFVNDGSTDHSLETIRSLQENDTKVRLLDFSRNFGEPAARMEGLRRSRGELVFLIPSDLEVSPSEFGRFWEEFHRSPGIDFVYGVHSQASGRWFERMSRYLFYFVCNRVSPLKVIPNSAGCHLMSRRFVRGLLQQKERTIFFAGLCAQNGFEKRILPVNKVRRRTGGYSLRKRFVMACECLISFSDVPLRMIFPTGLAMFTLGAALGINEWVSSPPNFLRFALPSLWVIGGMTLCALGIVGKYLSGSLPAIRRRYFPIVREWQ